MKQHIQGFLIGLLVAAVSFGVYSVMHKHEHNHAEHTGHKHGKKDKHDDHKGHDHGSKGSQKGHDDHKDDEHKGEIKLNSKALKHVKIRTVETRLTPSSIHQIDAVGRVALPPSGVSRVGSRVKGRIVKWYVQIGTRVRKGQALALLDSPIVGQARAQDLRKHALYRLASIEYKRTQKLKRSGLASARQLVAAHTALKKAKINLRAAHAQLRILGLSTTRHTPLNKITGLYVLRSPYTGEVTSLSKTLGSWVQPEMTLLHIENRKRLWALLEVYARDIQSVRVGQSVHIYGAGIGQHIVGTINYLSNRFERGAQTVEARVLLNNKKGLLRPGQFVYGLIQKHARKSTTSNKTQPVLLLPEDAIQNVGNKQIVFIRGTEPGHFRIRTVVAIEAPEGKVRILYGLKEKEHVVVQGSFVLKSELMRSALEGGHGHAH